MIENANFVVLDKKDNIIEFKTKKVVTKVGDGGHIVLPKKLIGKMVEVYYKK